MQERVDALTRDRDRVLDVLLGGAVPNRRQEIAQVEQRETEETRSTVEAADQGTPINYSTPFDSKVTRFRQAHKNGSIPARYRARSN